jgi:hypothetical protein
MAEQLAQLAEEGDVYSRLAGSIAPEIFGMEDVKKVGVSGGCVNPEVWIEVWRV